MEENTIVYPEPPYRVSGNENNIYIPEIEGVEYRDSYGTVLPDATHVFVIGYSPDKPREQPLPTRGLTIKAVPKEGYEFEEWDETEWLFENTMFFLDPVRSRFNRNIISVPEAKSPVWGYFLVINYEGNNEGAEDYSGMSYHINQDEEVYIYAPDNTDGQHNVLDEWYFEYIPNLIQAFPETPHQEGNTVFVPEVEGVRYTDSFSGDDVSGEIEIEEDIGDLNIYALPENGYFFEEDDDFGYDWFYFYEYPSGALAPYRSEENRNVIIIPPVEPPVSRYVSAMTGETVVGSVPIDNLQFGYIDIYAEDEFGYWMEEWTFDFEYILIIPVKPARFENTVTIPEVDGITYYRDWVEEITGTLEIPKDDFLYIGAEVDWQNGYDWDWDNMGDTETEWYFDYDPSFDEPEEPIEVTPAPPVFTDDFVNGGGTFTTVYTEGVIYVPAEGTAEPGETIVITATPEDGYTLVGTTEWVHTFPEQEEPEPEPEPEPPVQRTILVLEQEIIKYLRTEGFNASHASPVSPTEITDDYIVVNRISGGETWVQARWTTATVYIDCHIPNPEVTGRDRYDAARLAYKVVESLKSFMKENTWARKIEGVSVTDSSFGDYTYYTVSATLSHNYL